jgi:enoyl-CoA hydratase/carnithine racemase
MTYDGYEVLRVTAAGGVARATIDNPPINLLDLALMLELDRFGRETDADDAVRVVVLDSANPEFFIAHADVSLILQLPRDADAAAPTELGFFHAMVDRFRTMPKATIAVIEGIVRGGGCELVESFDMRFAAIGRAVLGQPEVPLGILPGGSGTQRLPRLIGRGRAMEMVLGGGDVDAVTAERWGLVNRALEPDALHPFVDHLAARIASFPAPAIGLAKASVLAAEPDPVPGMLIEAHSFNQTLTTAEAIRRMEEFMRLGGPTREVELDIEALYDKLEAP